MRRMVIAGNWKMNNLRVETELLLSDLLGRLTGHAQADVVICPPYIGLSMASAVFADTGLKLGAQDVFWKEKGAYTGQISPQMLVDVGCEYVIVGHSEKRGRFGVPEPDFDADTLAHFGDNDVTVNRKLRAAQAAGLTVICCVGETLSERQTGTTDAIVEAQTIAALNDVSAEDAAKIIFAYEPVWAIGTGEVCASDEADRVCGIVRNAVGKLHGTATAEAIRVQYGGSVKPDNAQELLGKPNIDGALVGGASLKAADFAAIVAAA